MSDPIGKLISITWWRTVFQKTGKGFGYGCAIVFAVPLALVGINNWSGRNNQNSGPVGKDAVLMTVNGDPVSMGDYYAISGSAQLGAPGENYARQAGDLIKELVKQEVIVQEAKREGVKANDAEVDKAIQDLKVKQLGKNATDADLENVLYQARHISLADYREQLAKGMLGQALVENAKKRMVVTEEEARNQSADVRLTVVLIPTIPSVSMGLPPDPRALPDAAAQKKAEALLAEVKSGKAKIGAIARADSSDYTNKKDGDTDFQPEYKSAGLPESMGVMGFGKDFDEAVHKAKVGDYTPVIKASGFRSGYAFAKVTERRNTLPKDFAPQKVVDQLKEQRAQEATIKKITDLTKAAKVVFPADRIEQKAYYDEYLVSEMDPRFSFGSPSAATPDQVAAQKALADSEMAAVYKKDPTNTTAAILVLDSVQNKLKDPKTPPAEQTSLREQLLPLYQNIIKMTEGDDYAYRFGLGDALRDKKQFLEAYKNFHTIGRLLDLDTPTELKTMQAAAADRQHLAMALKSVESPEAPLAAAEAVTQAKKVLDLRQAITLLQAKQQQEQQMQEAIRKKQAEDLKAHPPKKGSGASSASPEGFPSTLNLAPGASQNVTVPVPGSAPKTPPAPSTSGTPVPPSTGGPAPTTKPTVPPTTGGTGK